MVDLKGICQVCGKAGSLVGCWKCGRQVCAGCINEKTGLCIVCEKEAPKRGPADGPRGQLAVPESERPIQVKPDGVRK